MAARPYQHMRVDELDRLFTDAPLNAARLDAILTELGFRSTSRALDLKRRLEDHLKVGPKASHQKAAVAPEQPSPAMQPMRRQPAYSDEANSESAGGTGDARRSRPNQQEIHAKPLGAESKLRAEP